MIPGSTRPVAPWPARFTRFLVALGLVSLCPLVAPALGEAGEGRDTGPVARVVILSGQGNPRWRTTTPILRRILEQTGRFEVQVRETPEALTAADLKPFDAIVDDAGIEPTGPLGTAIAAFVESGKGLVMTHGALAVGRPAAAGETNRFLDLSNIAPEHPITSGIPTLSIVADNPIPGLALEPGAVVLIVARDHGAPASHGEPALTAASMGRGRVVHFALGHDPRAMREATFATLLAQAAEWPPTARVSPRPTGIKALLITGGHDHDASFYSLFQGWHELASMPVESSATAFQKDLRANYDVIVMYDFSRTIDEIGKKNLLDYVKGGKGVVVLHHALLDYPDWPEWSRDVVGGRYRLKREGAVPSSTVKNGQQLVVTPADHPITAGIGPFHIEDETYKGMFMSDGVRPLLTTDNPASDARVGWIGPGVGSRVVAIQLGHGPTAFANPAYRAVVRNAVVWAAGRTP